MRFLRVMRISRPRFWIYELWPYMIWILAAMISTGVSFDALSWRRVLIFAVFFAIPANIWIYGINDIYDYETDKLNPKKQWYEALVEPREHRKLWSWILITTLPFMIFLPIYSSVRIAFALFLFFSAQYSATPIRAKGRPIFDSLFSAGHYIATAAFWFFLVAPSTPLNYYYIVAGMLWAIAMHAYSAVPDIKADMDAWVPTIATFLWAKWTLFLCFVLYVVSAFLVFPFGWWITSLLSVLYCVMMGLSFMVHTDKRLFALYKWFPWINTICGMVLFFMLLIKIL